MNSDFPTYNSVPQKGRLRSCLSMLRKHKPAKKIIVDVGSSYGWLEYSLRRIKTKRIIGVDPNEAAVSYAADLNKNADFYLGRADKIPVKKSYADIVTMFDVIEHVPVGGETDALVEAARVLKKGGVLLLSTPNDHLLTNLCDPAWCLGHRHYKKHHIIKLVKKSGFEVTSFKIKGGVWSIIYMNWFYIIKWVFRQKLPRNNWLEQKDDNDYRTSKLFTIYLEAKKV